MKALVTGDAGFVGRHFVKYLKELDWDVYGLDIVSDEDVREYFLDPNYDEYFDLVVHCAYEVGGRAHIDGTNMALAHNVAMDAAMFDWALKTYQGAVLYFSSSAAYPVCYQTKDEHLKLYEDLIDLDNLDDMPDANYGWAKITGEKIARQFGENGGRVHIVRPFSGYGGDQSLQYPFPSIIKRAIAGDLAVWGPPGQTRDWIHIDDVVAGAFAVYEADERRPVNLCTGRSTEMGDLMKMAYYAANDADGFWVWSDKKAEYLEDKPTGVFYRVGDPILMNEYYTATITLEEGVREAIGKATEKSGRQIA